jgi:LysR family transcriptional regulator, chromosome initiation inhibitor
VPSRTTEAIAHAPGVTFNQKDLLQQEWIRQTLGRSIAFPTHWLPSTHGFVNASLAGMGWALNPVHLVAEHLASGRLVELVPGAALDRPLFWQVNRLAAEHLSALTRSVLATARKSLIQDGPTQQHRRRRVNDPAEAKGALSGPLSAPARAP